MVMSPLRDEPLDRLPQMVPIDLDIPPCGAVIPMSRQGHQGRGGAMRGQPGDIRVPEAMECDILKACLPNILDEQIRQLLRQVRKEQRALLIII